MRRSIVRYCLFSLLAVSASAGAVLAQAKFAVKLGLWETTSTMEGATSDPAKICITAEKIATGAFDDPPNAECKHTITGQTATTMDVKATCASKEPPMSGTNTMHIQALSPTNVKGSMSTTMSMGGRSMTMNGTFTSKFVADKCGDVK
jgi:hypothetical protein